MLMTENHKMRNIERIYTDETKTRKKKAPHVSIDIG